MVNNVASARPRASADDAAAAPAGTLNTNSRFNYVAVVEFCERLAATAPDRWTPSSWSIPARRRSISRSGWPWRPPAATSFAVREAYHGWTYAPMPSRPRLADNPNALSTRPAGCTPWTRPTPSAGAYRAPRRRRYAADAAQLIERARGRPPSAGGVYRRGGSTATPAACRCPTAISRGIRRRPARRRARHRGRGPGRVRPPGPLVLGLRAARRGARTS